MIFLLIGVFIFLILFLLIVMFVDTHRLVVRKYTVYSSEVKENTRFVMLTDLHGVAFGTKNWRLYEKIVKEQPEYILIAGDMITAHRNATFKNTLDILELLSSKYPVYYSFGNHEEKLRDRKEEFGDSLRVFLSETGAMNIHVLDNDSKYIENKNIRIFGLSLPLEYYKKNKFMHPEREDIEKMVGKAKSREFSVLLAHNPEYFVDYAGWGADVVCSGHYHGGLMRLPVIGGVISPRYKLFPRYDFGEYDDRGVKMILSCGLGTHTLPIRIFNPGEISVIEIVKKT